MEPKWLSLSEIKRRQQTHPLRLSEIPTEHAISLPMPTKRWYGPAYAFFAGPSVRIKGQPMEQSPPDRWWVVNALGGGIIVYALWQAQPFSEHVQWDRVIIPPIEDSVSERRQALADIETLLDSQAPVFFSGDAGGSQQRRALALALATYLPQPLHPQYRALTPDFFAWLEA